MCESDNNLTNVHKTTSGYPWVFNTVVKSHTGGGLHTKICTSSMKIDVKLNPKTYD